MKHNFNTSQTNSITSRNNKVLSSAGFTLIETILYIGAAAIIILGLSVFLTKALKSRAKNAIQVEVQTQGTQAFQTMTQAVRNADDANVIQP